MHKLLLSCSMLLSVAAMAQEAPAGHQSAKPSRWQIGLNVSPQINYRLLRATPGDQGSAIAKDSRNQSEIPRPQYTAGVSLGYQLNEHISLNSGLQYSNWGGQTKRRDLIYAFPNPALPTQVSMLYNINYLILPATVNVTFGHKRLKFTAGAGLNAMYLLREQTRQSLFYASSETEIQTTNTSYYRKFNLAAQLSAGVDYALNEKVHLKLEPIFRFAVIKSVNAPVKENLYNYGLNIGTYWKI
ncbi:outer membrane beta-barrel protein [Edaphocola aurantiacus]|uniref:outer membrane beta-barrel protein n=1 Tax=Edaphocola aurantiacus TaxID=2601682 RepID=UPI001C958F7C|nr:outer membrane beta-barrel protein [Edaphocola aurantiacus]